ncbi:hypothetical protein CTAYLR_001920 [Chrysophaeum taylorii]|uniref:Lipase maturation factor n=1 Tax=Chrysophaeum taylorii TaxID=2483200 RepID=A0AAD7U8E7_9STRA|nr:hypothetical protein CTAYLR_001920 [Chrysophaeum taylorii]
MQGDVAQGPGPSSVGEKKVESSESFCTTKLVLLTSLGVVYAVAFCSAYYQNGALLGERGLAPARPSLAAAWESKSSLADLLWRRPSLMWFWWPVEDLDAALSRTAALGIATSMLLILGAHYSWVCLVLWLLYHTLCTTASASSFYAYGWESQLLETGFLAIFLCSPTNASSPPSRAALYLFRWLAFRIAMGAGLIKLRGGSCWSAKECLFYHFETQPIPSPLSFFFHFLPKETLSLGVDVDIFVQCYASWLLLVPSKWPRRVGGLVQATFMLIVAASGNFAFLNHLTIIPSLACFDDAFFRAAPSPESMVSGRRRRLLAARALDVLLVALVAYLSIPVVANLASRDQRMNATFDPFRIVNTYGAFGSVGKRRVEPVVSLLDRTDRWHEIDFPCKPGDVYRRPCFSAPYHYRVDWNLWFLGFEPHAAVLRDREKWVFELLAQLLDRAYLPALATILDAHCVHVLFNGRDAPFTKERPPKAVKVDMYVYEMAQPLWGLLHDALKVDHARVKWWNRTYKEPLVPPLALSADDSPVRLVRVPRTNK